MHRDLSGAMTLDVAVIESQRVQGIRQPWVVLRARRVDGKRKEHGRRNGVKER